MSLFAPSPPFHKGREYNENEEQRKVPKYNLHPVKPKQINEGYIYIYINHKSIILSCYKPLFAQSQILYQ